MTTKTLNITLGCDPELFVKTKTGQFRSAHGLIPGTKANPHKVNFGAVQVDGMALEFNIDAVNNEDDWVRNIGTVMGQMQEMVPDYDFAVTPTARFNGNHFRAQPDEAKELGCEPDFNAYTLGANPRPDNQTTMRTASGHVHIGFCEGADPASDEHMTRCATLVKQLDAYLGLPSILFDPDTQRRNMYGKAGAFRPKSYGLEYRVLSNAWLLSEARQRFVFQQAVKAVNDLIAGKRASAGIKDDTLQHVINESDKYNAGFHLRAAVQGGHTAFNTARAL